ncbi:NAD(P)-dependent oxidoreductase [Flavilitoribacter nigricans]|uniref:NAD(P)-binding domain-containing protein n=1 Tax=Flavilitoribacter nigricans (strain ATCC 23147 / DSM 23189 / NBRC 102662 / NCIMB 1420 / SS-2) TaxID=1122177 RepID=A0A2D0N1H0_FLAN2|nr:SDR family oxidoreductase [Flavilitoribacter nigricans]PHN02364.1 hypothetical protein CRP01_32485 [Flavilitoribacter nigricans DSM 23189 = NBRC 102662]
MKVFLLGATGSTGYEVLKQLVQDGYAVKALVRDPTSLSLSELEQSQNGQIEVIQGGIFEPEKLKAHLEGCDVVISALGTGRDNRYTEVYSEGGRNILAAMRANGIKRLITVTSGLIDMSDPGTDNFFLNRIIRPNFNKVYYDQTRWETILDDTNDIDWTCVRPTYLTNKSFTGKYRVKDQHCPEGGRKISRADLAHFMVQQIDSGEFIRRKPVLAY